jgi:2-oxoglutarate dehydrogenase complex dehydrogenase (E1) component-like enzyme
MLDSPVVARASENLFIRSTTADECVAAWPPTPTTSATSTSCSSVTSPTPPACRPKWQAYFASSGEELAAALPLVRRLRELYPRLFGEPVPASTRGVAESADAVRASDASRSVASARALVEAHRRHGHLAARLDPLGPEPAGDPALDPARLSPPLPESELARIPADVLEVAVPGETLADVLPRLRDAYCGTMAHEIEHIASREQLVWLRREIESGSHRRPLDAAGKRARPSAESGMFVWPAVQKRPPE